MVKNIAAYALVATLIALASSLFRWWASTVSFDYRAPLAAFGIVCMLIIGVFGWGRMNKVARWYLIAVFFIGTLAIAVSAWLA